MAINDRLKQKDDIVLHEEDNEWLLFNPANGAVSVLNETGWFIWQNLNGERSRDDIVAEVAESFDVEDRKSAEQDFDKFVDSLGRQGFLKDYRFIPTLQSICFAITSKCNLNCKHCLNRNTPDQEPDMTTEKLFDVIDQMAEMGVKGVSIFGGEPLCHPDFKRIVEYLNSRKISSSLNTNGTLIDQDMARWLRTHGINGTVVSFDGSGPAVMDRIRGKGAFEKAVAGIKALRAEGINVLLSVTLNKMNYNDIREMVIEGKRTNGNSIRFNHVFFGGNAECFTKEIYLSPREEKEAIEAIAKAREEFGDFVSASSSYLCQGEKLKQLKDQKPSNGKLVVLPCGAANGKCAIRADGWVTPCEIIWEVKCGNLKEKSLKDIWEHSEPMDSFRKPMEIDLDELPECKDCNYQYLCFVGHRCFPYHYPGGIKNRGLYCWRKEEIGLADTYS